MSATLSSLRQRARAAFTSLDEMSKNGEVFFENAGGSQTPDVVCDAVRDHMIHHNAQLGAGYARSDRATAVVEEAHELMLTVLNGRGVGEVVMGPSTSALLLALAQSVAPTLAPGDRIIVDATAHEAQAGPWTKLAAAGAEVVFWRCRDGPEGRLSLADLEALLTPRTKVVAVAHVSNLLGAVLDLPAVCRLAHAAGAKVVCDGVAYAPHRPMDVQAWGVDFYVFSNYKVYGPHGVATMFGTHAAFAELVGPNHFFVDPADKRYKFELGGNSHEALAGVLALQAYLNCLLARPADSVVDRAAAVEAFSKMSELEAPLMQQLLAFLTQQRDVTIIGPRSSDVADRVPTISFVHARLSNEAIVKGLHGGGIMCRSGHMYSARLTKALSCLDDEAGVVRLSLLHYNTPAEVEQTIRVLSALFEGTPASPTEMPRPKL